ncbi:phospholipid carrier-dependent glycosyltransferase [Candidatus Microgenomates bacterium]|nr:MAG: phospholipid carrier-dependent glycosyltransferase [Candidatus Microgenomates bacterium]
MKRKKFFLYLTLSIIVIIGFTLRVYRNVEIPPGFFADEASIGYNAFTLLTKGSDEAGNRFPILFQNFGNFYRPPISIYISSVFVYFLGLNEFSVRLSAAVFGTLTIITVFYLSRILFSSDKIGLLSSLFLAISPWHIHFSRINQEFIYLVFFLTLSIHLFLLTFKNKKPFFLILSFIMFGLSLYTYVTAYFLIPIFLVSILFIYRKNVLKIKKVFFWGLAIFFIMTLPLVIGLTNGKTLSRFYQVSGVNKEKTNITIISGAINTYVNHFLPEFLFEKGDIDYHNHFITRFSVRGMGQLYWFQLPLIVLGLILAARKNKNSFLLLFAWLIVYPLGSTMAPFADGGGPFSMRSITGVIPFQILSAVGFIYLFSLIKKNYFKIIMGFILFTIIIFSFKTYLYNYFIKYPLYAADFWGWQYGARDIVKYFSENELKYNELIMIPEFNAPDIFFKFYASGNCFKCKLGTPSESYNPKLKQLFAVSQNYLEEHSYQFKTLKTIYYPNKKVAFQIGEVLE